jgi:small subunit ribosomal protein S13
MAEEHKQNQRPQAPKEVQKEAASFRYIVRIANTDLDGKKQVLMGLQKIKGVSFMLANAICNLTKLQKTKRVGDLSDQEIEILENQVKSKKPTGIPTWMLNRRNDYETGEDIHLIGADLTFSHESDLRRLKKIKSYRGIRHMLGQPVRGQRTRSNFRKNKGKVTSVKRSVVAKAENAAAAKGAAKGKEKGK